ncbi:myb/SANT-like DNA-binding domain-containing protein 3 [Ixodes scapularis]|uniref:myb/SANT-like DNA-binding domain-containing protein 3 n=1 Tax=Ixodes scapularis TaxID=6945 RepID=UPI001C383038|nr:myb/SANT-like DNA-binding domain-containing protein 3 [Ixodes scapularis]
MDKAKAPAARFTEIEKAILMELVMTYKKIIECKKTDESSLNKKKATWIRLCNEYNCNHGVYRRDVKQLKKWWENVKAKAKKDHSKEKNKVHKTGGGPHGKPMSATSVLVGAVASHVFNRQENMEDSDGAPYLPPVCSLPVLRLLQPMLDGEEDPLDADLEEPGSPAGPASDVGAPLSPAAACIADRPAAAPAACLISQTSTAGSPAPTPAAAAACNSGSAAAAVGSGARQVGGRMALLKRSLAEENDMRMAFVQQEHALRCNFLEQDHRDALSKRAALHEMEIKLREDELKKRNAIHEMEMKLLCIKENILLQELSQKAAQ